MVRPIHLKAKERQKAIAGVKHRIYRNVEQAAKDLGVSKTMLHRRLQRGKSRSEGKENQQRLTPQEEKALAEWISAVGNPIQHHFICEMAEQLIKQRVQDNQIVPQLGSSWVPSFLRRHRHLKTAMTRAIETSHIKDIIKEQILHFNKELRRLIQEHNIRLEDILKRGFKTSILS